MLRGKEGRTKRDFTPSKQIEYFNNVAPPKTDLSGFPSLLNAKCIHAPQLRTAQIATNAVATDLVPRPSPTGRSSVFTAHQTRLWNCESRALSNSRPNRQSGGDPEVAARNRKRGGRAASHPQRHQRRALEGGMWLAEGRVLPAYAPLRVRRLSAGFTLAPERAQLCGPLSSW